MLVLTTFSFWEEDWALHYNSMELWDFLKPYFVWQLVSQLVFAIFISNSHVLFHLLWKKHLVKYLQVPKYYDYGFKFQKWHLWEMALIGQGVHPLFHQNCHHQIIYVKFDLKIYYLSPCCRAVFCTIKMWLLIELEGLFWSSTGIRLRYLNTNVN